MEGLSQDLHVISNANRCPEMGQLEYTLANLVERVSMLCSRVGLLHPS